MRGMLVAGLALLLTACGGGGGGGGGGGAASPGSPGQAAPTVAEAGRLLSQASFGAKDEDISAVQSAGLRGWIDQQMAIPVTTPTHFDHMNARLPELQAINAGATLSANQFYESFWLQAATRPDQLRQRVTFALSQIFVISLADSNIDPRGAASYYDMLSRNAFGNFRTLLGDVTMHPQMGIYLTYRGNQREDANGTRTPDENYSREVMQLFTIGLYELNADGTLRLDGQARPIPTYTATDISQLAKVFTGLSWYHPTPTNSTFTGGNANPDRHWRPMVRYPQFYSISQKRFLTTTIPATTTATAASMEAELNTALDALFNHPSTGPTFARGMIQRLVTSNPSPAYVGRVAAVFANNGNGVRGDMAAVIRAILLDAEARDAANISAASFGKIREPIVRNANWLRTFGATSQSGDWLITSTSANTSLGQSPLTSPSVFNFYRPGFVPAGTSQLGQRGLLAPEMQIVDEITTAGYINIMQNWIDQGIGSTPPGGSGRDVRVAYTAEVALADNVSGLIDRMDRLLLSGQMSSGLRQRMTTALNGIALTGTQTQIDTARLNRAKLAVFMTMTSNDYIVQR